MREGFAAGGFAARRKTPLQSPLSPGRKAKGRGGIKGGEGKQNTSSAIVGTIC
jgi:hypothetical protein